MTKVGYPNVMSARQKVLIPPSLSYEMGCDSSFLSRVNHGTRRLGPTLAKKAVELGYGDIFDHLPYLIDLLPLILAAAKARGMSCPSTGTKE